MDAAESSCIGLHFVLWLAPIFAPHRKKRPGCVCSQPAAVGWEHTHSLNAGILPDTVPEIKIPISHGLSWLAAWFPETSSIAATQRVTGARTYDA